MKNDFSIEQKKKAIKKANFIISMLQGTMGLEGQGLDKSTLRRMKKQTTLELLQKDSPSWNTP